jgi:hypothetical protein
MMSAREAHLKSNRTIARQRVRSSSQSGGTFLYAHFALCTWAEERSVAKRVLTVKCLTRSEVQLCD